jgi:hypothetical protein
VRAAAAVTRDFQTAEPEMTFRSTFAAACTAFAALALPAAALDIKSDVILSAWSSASEKIAVFDGKDVRVLSSADDGYSVRIDPKASRLTSLSISPSGRTVAFVADKVLFIVEVDKPDRKTTKSYAGSSTDVTAFFPDNARQIWVRYTAANGPTTEVLDAKGKTVFRFIQGK